MYKKWQKKKKFFLKQEVKQFGRTDDKCPTSAGKVGAVGKVSVIIPTSGIWFGSSEAFKKDKRAGRRGFREPKCKTSQKRGKKRALPWMTIYRGVGKHTRAPTPEQQRGRFPSQAWRGEGGGLSGTQRGEFHEEGWPRSAVIFKPVSDSPAQGNTQHRGRLGGEHPDVTLFGSPARNPCWPNPLETRGQGSL